MIELRPMIEELTEDAEPGNAREILEATCLSIHADGDVHPDEHSTAYQIAKALIPDSSDGDLKVLLAQTLQALEQHGGWRRALPIVAEKLRGKALGTRQAALALAALVQYVDGHLADEEEQLLDSLSHALNLDLSASQSVIDRV